MAEGLRCKRCRVIHAAACPVERVQEQAEVCLRVSSELRQFLSDAPPADKDTRSLLSDCSELEHLGNWLLRELRQ